MKVVSKKTKKFLHEKKTLLKYYVCPMNGRKKALYRKRSTLRAKLFQMENLEPARTRIYLKISNISGYYYYDDNFFMLT